MSESNANWLVGATDSVVDEYLSIHQGDFSLVESAVLRFIKDRTLRWGKHEEAIPFHHFTKGFCTTTGRVIIGPIAAAEATIRKALYTLIDKGWVIRSYTKGNNNVDKATVYALNVSRFADISKEVIEHVKKRISMCAKVLHVSTAPDLSVFMKKTFSAQMKVGRQISVAVFKMLSGQKSEEDMYLKEPKNTRAGRVQQLETGGSSGQRLYKGINTLVEKEEEVAIAPSRSASRAVASRIIRRSSPSIAIDCKMPSATEVVQKITADSRAARAARVQAIAVKKSYTKQDMQAVFDKATADQPVSLPRIVLTDKCFGMLKKKLKEHAITDVSGFITFCVSRWLEIAYRYNLGIQRGIEAGTSTPMQKMLMVPDAWQIALRVSRLSVYYGQHIAGGFQDMGKKIADEKVAALQKENQRLERYAADLRGEKSRLEQKIFQRPERQTIKLTQAMVDSRLDDDLYEDEE